MTSASFDTNSYRIITDVSQLQSLCNEMLASSWLALDTEFVRDKTYYPIVCLIQIASEHDIACIDTLAIDDLTPLNTLLSDPSITKVLHAASQDLEICQYLFGQVPAPVFDTQIAAALLGHGEQIGYANLVSRMLNIDLDKTQTRTDWSQRPLQTEQLDYAVNDVRYLRTIYQQQKERLSELGRLHWLSEDFAALSDPQRYRPDPALAWTRVKGHGRLSGLQLAALRALASWRERQAMDSNKPRRWVIGDDVLLTLAQRLPKDLKQLPKLRGLDANKITRHGQALLDCIETARREPRAQWPVLAKYRTLDNRQEALIDALMATLRLCAHEHGIAASALAGRKDLEALVAGDDVALRHGWRAQLLGRDLDALLLGKANLQVSDGLLRLARVE